VLKPASYCSMVLPSLGIYGALPPVSWHACCRYWIDEASAETVDQRVQKGLFLFACTNSCMNPIVYGYFNFRSGRGSGYAAPGGRAGQQVRYIYSTTATKSRHNSLAGSHWHQCRVVAPQPAPQLVLVVFFYTPSPPPSFHL
jgi:hypothetical protein